MKRAEVERETAMMSVVRQCGLLELSRSTFYYQPVGEAAYNLGLMRLIDEQFTKRPFYGVARMTASLRTMGFGVNPKRVRRLMRVMGRRPSIRSRGSQPTVLIIGSIPIF